MKEKYEKRVKSLRKTLHRERSANRSLRQYHNCYIHRMYQ